MDGLRLRQKSVVVALRLRTGHIATISFEVLNEKDELTKLRAMRKIHTIS